jgi:transposase
LLAATPPTGADDAVLDKGYDSDSIREDLLNDDLVPNIPNRSNRVDPWPFDRKGYRERNRIERLINKLKQFRGIATRYDKLATTFLGFIHLTLAFIMIR